MGKVISVWGSPGSGKSMFCCILAKALTRDKRKVPRSFTSLLRMTPELLRRTSSTKTLVYWMILAFWWNITAVEPKTIRFHI